MKGDQGLVLHIGHASKTCYRTWPFDESYISGVTELHTTVHNNTFLYLYKEVLST